MVTGGISAIHESGSRMARPLRNAGHGGPTTGAVAVRVEGTEMDIGDNAPGDATTTQRGRRHVFDGPGVAQAPPLGWGMDHWLTEPQAPSSNVLRTRWIIHTLLCEPEDVFRSCSPQWFHLKTCTQGMQMMERGPGCPQSKRIPPHPHSLSLLPGCPAAAACMCLHASW